MHDVFISYSSYNKYIADAICHRLESGGVKCWYAPRDIPGGEEWPAAIVRAIRASRVFILIYSKESNQSKQILREVTTAVDSECVIIPFRIDESEMSNNLAYYLNTLHWLDAVSPPLESNIEQLYQRVRAVVGIKTEIEQRVQFPAAEPTTPAEVNPPEKKPKKQKRRKWLIPLAVLLLLFAGILVMLASGVVSNDRKVQTINLLNISNLGRYRYPFFGTSMFSVYGDAYIVENLDTGKLSFAKTDTGFRFLEDLSYTPKDPTRTVVVGYGIYDVIYFIEADPFVVKIYDTKSGEWINETGIPLNLSETESLHHALEYFEYMSAGESHKDEIVVLIYDQDPNLQCISRAITFYPNGTYVEKDISHLNLTSILVGIDKAELHSVLMVDKFHNIQVLDVASMEIRELTNQEILDAYMPFAVENRAVISESGNYYCAKDFNGVSVEITIWDIFQEKQIFHKAFTGNFQGYFLNEHEYIFFNGEDGCVYVCDLQTGRTTLKLEPEFFKSNGHFLMYPSVFTYDPKLDMILFASSGPTKSGTGSMLKITAIDLDGNILAESKEIELPYGLFRCQIIVVEDKILVFATSADLEKDYGDGVNTICLRARFYYDEEGKPIFTEQ